MIEHDIKRIDMNELSPYIRFIHRESTDFNKFYIPWRELYDYEMYFVVGGKMRIILQDKEYVLGPNSIHFMPPFTWHKRCIDRNYACEYYSIHFDLCYSNESNNFDPNDVYRRPCDIKLEQAFPIEKLEHRTIYELTEFEFPQQLTIVESQRVTSILNEMLYNFNEKPMGYVITLKSHFLNILNIILNQLTQLNSTGKPSTISFQTNLVKNIREHLESNYNQKLNFSKIAKDFAISSAYLRSIFKKYENISLIDYLTNIRIDKAKSLLLDGKHTVTEISELVGYSDLQTFSRVFKNKVLLSPQAYVKSLKK